MNLGAHIVVASALRDDPRFLLGSALPDVGSMRGFRLLGDSPSAEIERGIAVHHTTDDVFHGSEWFLSRQKRLRTVLDAAGLNRGASRAVAHVGPELLIDGVLLLDEAHANLISRAIAEIPEAMEDLLPLVPDHDRHAAFRGHLLEVAAWGTPTDHHDPNAVAQRLFRILSRRRRLRMEEHQIKIAAEALADEYQSLAETTQDLVNQIASKVHPDVWVSNDRGQAPIIASEPPTIG